MVHAGGDATGAEVERALVAAAGDRRLPLLTGHVAVDALCDGDGAVTGLAVLDDAGRRGVLHAPAVLLASGGYGQLYASTTNPATATGDGIALALRAGATVADLEFVQFHPTVLYTGPAVGAAPVGHRGGARRGCRAAATGRAGGSWQACTRSPTWHRATSWPRRSRARWPRPAPTACTSTPRRCPASRGGSRPSAPRAAPRGSTRRASPIPVTPAAHYACGGVVTDLHGRTRVPGLYAAGEVARTGLHGANRLASNSLLEGLVLGARAAGAVAADRGTRRGAACLVPSPAVPLAPRAVVQRAMTGAAGIGRDAAGLAAASDAVEAATATGVPVDRAGVEDAALTLLAQVALAAAGTRTESRGCHVRTDFPERDDVWQRASLVVALDEAGHAQVQAGTVVVA